MEVDLQLVARQAMAERGFLVDFPPEVRREAEAAGPIESAPDARDLTNLQWSSIDNIDSRDIDQIEYAQEESRGIRLWVGIADVDALVSAGSATDGYAQANTTSIYTGVRTFAMLPERFSTDLSSLGTGQRRLAMVTEALVDADGLVLEPQVYPAMVKNRAQLAYPTVSKWLEDSGSVEAPEAVRRDPLLQSQLKLQERAAGALRKKRQAAGALSFAREEFRPFMAAGELRLEVSVPNRATQLVEDLMIAANQITAAYLEKQKFPSIRRVVRRPQRWDRIVELAARRGTKLPGDPDSGPLEAFLQEQRRLDPAGFSDLSLTVIKLLGRGEYTLQTPGETGQGHFSLAVDGYAHSTAPNRRYPDLITQRLVKAAHRSAPCPYSEEALGALAAHCTAKQDDARKVERQVHKCMAALWLAPRRGEVFDGIITGIGPKGTWMRILNPPVEGRLEGRVDGLEIGERVRARLVHTDPWKGHIDFVRI